MLNIADLERRVFFCYLPPIIRKVTQCEDCSGFTV